MNDHRAVLANMYQGSEAFAAELTDAAYRVALRHGVAGSSIDLELDLWRAMGDTVQRWKRPIPSRQSA